MLIMASILPFPGSSLTLYPRALRLGFSAPSTALSDTSLLSVEAYLLRMFLGDLLGILLCCRIFLLLAACLGILLVLSSFVEVGAAAK